MLEKKKSIKMVEVYAWGHEVNPKFQEENDVREETKQYVQFRTC